MKKKKIVLAYSGGLDTSIILKWLQENYNTEVIAYTADIGQKINKKKIIKNAKALGAKTIIIEDLKDIFDGKSDFSKIFLNSSVIFSGELCNIAGKYCVFKCDQLFSLIKVEISFDKAPHARIKIFFDLSIISSFSF